MFYICLALTSLFLKIPNNLKNKLNSDGHFTMAWEVSALKKISFGAKFKILTSIFYSNIQYNEYITRAITPG